MSVFASVFAIAGSPSAHSRSTALLCHIANELSAGGLRTEIFAVRDLPPEDILYGRYQSESILAAAARLQQSRVVLLATPIYKAALSGVLKAFLDLLPQKALAGKIVLPIGVGGSSAHLLAIDYSLRPVLAALDAQHVLPALYATDAQLHFDEEKELRLESSLIGRVDESVQNILCLCSPAPHLSAVRSAA